MAGHPAVARRMTQTLDRIIEHVRAKARPGQYDAILLAEVDRLTAENAEITVTTACLQVENVRLTAENARLIAASQTRAARVSTI